MTEFNKLCTHFIFFREKESLQHSSLCIDVEFHHTDANCFYRRDPWLLAIGMANYQEIEPHMRLYVCSVVYFVAIYFREFNIPLDNISLAYSIPCYKTRDGILKNAQLQVVITLRVSCSTTLCTGAEFHQCKLGLQKDICKFHHTCKPQANLKSPSGEWNK